MAKAEPEKRKIQMADIARLAGLGSQTNMRQLFINRYGRPPSQYRQTNVDRAMMEEI